MTDFSTGIPNIRVIIREAENENLLMEVPNISVNIQQGSQYNVNITPNSVTPLRTGSFNTYADLAGQAVTASYALVAQTLIGSVQSASFAYTASNVLGGTKDYIPIWSSSTTLSSSLLYQTGSSVLLGATTQHTPEAPDRFGVFAGVTDSYNLISAHGEIDNYLQVNVKNFSSGSDASTDLVATADVGTEVGGFINLGINNSDYSVPGAIGGPLDGYLYVTGSDLLIGNSSADKSIVLFTGGGDAVQNARVLIDPSGSVGINTSVFDTQNPEALLVQSVNDTTFNLIKGFANPNNYLQLNIQNVGTGDSASADIVATANNGTETSYYIDMGINSSNYAIENQIGGPNDAYLYSTGNHLHIGNASPGQDLMFFVGDSDVEAAKKLTLRDNNQHDVTGSLTITEGITGSLFGTASWAISSSLATTASYALNAAGSGFPFSGSAIITGSLLVSQSGVTITGSLNVTQGITGSLLGTSSWAISALTASYISGGLSVPNGLVMTGSIVISGSEVLTGSLNVTQGITGSLLGTSSWASNAISSSFATTASAANSITFTPATASFSLSSSRSVTSSFAITSSYAANADLLDGLNSTIFATTGSNTFVGSQTITGSLITNADTLIFTGSMYTTGSMVVTGSINVFGGITGSLFGSSSYSLTSSYIDGGLY